jgi:thioredoxin 1
MIRREQPPGMSEEPAMEGAPVTVTDADFQSIVLDADKPALVFFWAPSAPACEQVRPIVKAICWEFSGRLVAAQMDVDANPRTPSQFGAQVAPIVVVFAQGAPVEVAADPKSVRALRGRMRTLVGD